MADRKVVLNLSLKSIDAAPLKKLGVEAKKAGQSIDQAVNKPRALNLGMAKPATALPVSSFAGKPATASAGKLTPAAAKVPANYAQRAPALPPIKPLSAAQGKALAAPPGRIPFQAKPLPQLNLGNIAGPAAARGQSSEEADILHSARKHARLENLKDKVLGRTMPEVLPGNAKARKALEAGKVASGGGLMESLGLGKLTKALGPAAVAFGAASAAAAAVGGAVKKMAAEIQSLVSVANPGAMKRFTYAIQDAQAVIGHSLTPVVEIWTKEIRVLGDFLAAILPSAKEVRDIFGGMDGAFSDMREVLADVAPYIKTALITGLKLYADFLKVFWAGIKKLLDLAKQFGLIKGGGKLPDSTGAAARSAKFQDADAAAKEFYQAIFSQQGADPQRETARNTGGILRALGELPGKIRAAILDGASRIVDAIKGILPAFANPFKDFKLPEFKFPELILPELKFPELKIPEFKNPFEGWKNPLENWKNPFLDWKNPLENWKNPFLDWKNPLENWKPPEFKLPEIQLPNIQLPRIPLPAPAAPQGGGGTPLDAARDAIRRWILPVGGWGM